MYGFTDLEIAFVKNLHDLCEYSNSLDRAHLCEYSNSLDRAQPEPTDNGPIYLYSFLVAGHSEHLARA